MTCPHAASGCNYPKVECPGLCVPVQIKTKAELSARIEIDGTIFELTRGTDDLAETPGRIGLWISPTWSGSTFKTYFDHPMALGELAKWLQSVDKALHQLSETVSK